MRKTGRIITAILLMALAAFVVGFSLYDSGVIVAFQHYMEGWRSGPNSSFPNNDDEGLPGIEDYSEYNDIETPEEIEEIEEIEDTENFSPEPSPQPETQPNREPEEQPAPVPPPAENKKNTEENNTVSTPTIYPGQKLNIPGKQGKTPSSSQVVNSGTVRSDTQQIALSFDSGWLYAQTIPLLDVLDEYGVKATFFPRALWVYNENNPASSYPDLAREIVKRGHTMGNHSLTHPDMRELTIEQVRHEIQESTKIIENITGTRPYLFRPPYGAYNSQILKILAEEGYPYTVMWTIDTHDWASEIRGQKITEEYIVNRVLNNASNNGIVLMHIGGQYTLEALPRIIKELREMGYSFNTIDNMLPPPGGEPVTYTVMPGDTLYRIAVNHGVTVEAIINVNNL